MLKLAVAVLHSPLKVAGVRATLTTKEADARTNVEAVFLLEEHLREANSSVEELLNVRTELRPSWDRNLALLPERDVLVVNFGQVTADQDTATSALQALHAEALDRDQSLGVVIVAVQRLDAKATHAKSRATLAETRIGEIGTKTIGLPGLIENLTWTVVKERAQIPGLVDAEMSPFRKVMSSALPASEMPVSEATDTFADGVPFSTSGTAADPSSSHAS